MNPLSAASSIESFDSFPITDVLPYERNAKIHTNSQIEAIAHSINQFGFVQPILLDENNVILAGHGRFLAATSLKLSHVPAWRVSGLCFDAKAALRLVDNKLNADTGWHPELLQFEIDYLLGEGFELDKFGLDSFMEQVTSDLSSPASNDSPNIIKQLVLTYPTEQFSAVLEALRGIIAETPQLQNNTEAVCYLLKRYGKV